MSSPYKELLSERLGEARAMAERLAMDGDRSGLHAVGSIERSYPDFTKLIAELAPYLASGEWSDVLIDARSACIPGQGIRTIAERFHWERGVPMPTFLPVAAGGNHYIISAGQIAGQLETLNPRGRVLFFSEYFASGESLERFAKAAGQIGLTAFDVATINADHPDDHYRKIISSTLPSAGARVYVGQNNCNTEYHGELFRQASDLTLRTDAGNVHLEKATIAPSELTKIASLAIDTLGGIMYEEHNL